MKKIIFCIMIMLISTALFADENYDWLMDHTWVFESGYYDPGNRLIIKKLELPKESIVYQERLRNERFTLSYQEKGTDKLYTLDNDFSNDKYHIEFRDNFSRLIFREDGKFIVSITRSSEQINKEYPLIGIWGKLPYLTEYRMVDPKDCLYYMEITSPFTGRGLPGDATRMGTYLLKQTGKNKFETVTAFPDGHFKLEIINEKQLILTPLFKLPAGEKGNLAARHVINRK